MAAKSIRNGPTRFLETLQERSREKVVPNSHSDLAVACQLGANGLTKIQQFGTKMYQTESIEQLLTNLKYRKDLFGIYGRLEMPKD